jgi:hypothetical protein
MSLVFCSYVYLIRVWRVHVLADVEHIILKLLRLNYKTQITAITTTSHFSLCQRAVEPDITISVLKSLNQQSQNTISFRFK